MSFWYLARHTRGNEVALQIMLLQKGISLLVKEPTYSFAIKAIKVLKKIVQNGTILI